MRVQPLFPMASPAPDRFRGTVQRWSIDAGPLAGSACDYTFHDDWSVSWRVVTGAHQGHGGRAREFRAQAVNAETATVAFSVAPGVTVVATLDFARRRLAGYQVTPTALEPLAGTLRIL